MDETIDLRPYVEALLRRWWVILGAVIVGVLIAAFLYFSKSDYRATALVAVTDPAQRLQFDPRIVNTLDLDTLLQSYPELAMSDGVLTQLLDEAKELSDGHIDSLPKIRDMIDVETGVDLRLVRLVVRNEDPQLAANLANAWANSFVTVVDTIYRTQGGEVEFFNNQLAETNAQLQVAEKALVDFQSGSRIGTIDNQLFSLNDLQASYLADQRRIKLVLDDIGALRSQIEAGDGDTVTWTDQLTALMLQMAIYETVSATPAPNNSIQLQLNSQSDLTTSRRAEQLNQLENLARSAENSLSEIDGRLLELEPQIFALQREKQDLFQQYEKLTRSRDVVKETYLTLARKIDESRIQSEDSTSGLKVASLAVPPAMPERSNLIVTATIAGMVGLLLSSAAIIAITWWKATTNRSAD